MTDVALKALLAELDLVQDVLRVGGEGGGKGVGSQVSDQGPKIVRVCGGGGEGGWSR